MGLVAESSLFAGAWLPRAPPSFFPLPLHDIFATRHAGHRLRHVQLRRLLGRVRRRLAPAAAGGRGHEPAHGGVLQCGRPPHALRPRCRGAVPQRHRRAPAALAQEPARQPAAERIHGGEPPAGELPADRGDLPGRAARARRAHAGPRTHARGDGPAGALRGRRSRARCVGPAVAARGGAGRGLRGRVVPVRADRRRPGPRAPPHAREPGAGGGRGRGHVGLHRGAPGPAAHGAGRPQRRRAAQRRACTSAARTSTSA